VGAQTSLLKLLDAGESGGTGASAGKKVAVTTDEPLLKVSAVKATSAVKLIQVQDPDSVTVTYLCTTPPATIVAKTEWKAK
jgi:hypothetical protein